MIGATSSYLQVGRLADVLALIQLLGFDESGYCTEERMKRELGRVPISANSWVEIAKAHPEFFRVREEPDRTIRAALIIRYIVGKTNVDGQDQRPPLTPDFAANFFQLAINLHDKQMLHRDRWKPWVFGLLGAAIAAAGAVFAAYLS